MGKLHGRTTGMRNRWDRRRTVADRALVEEENKRDLRKESENERKKVQHPLTCGPVCPLSVLDFYYSKDGKADFYMHGFL
jgi:hypothetical protein